MSKEVEFASILLLGDTDKAIEYIQKEKKQDHLSIYNDVMTPAMRYIGLLWEQNKITVAEEHLATATCDFVLSKLMYKNKREENNTKRAMFFCIEGEQHYLGLKMVDSLFQEHGWETKYYGPNLPLDVALQDSLKWQAKVICLSVSLATNLPKLKEYTKAFEGLPQKPAILVGGRLTSMYDLNHFTSSQSIVLKDLNSVTDWLMDWSTRTEDSTYASN
ncbi:cobalamin B12-binding domain-containing protein [Bacillus mesophilum]|uniref:cobalamin B12-binding domain-containing protein n=1 Tax=Bacillus mesophilum TaxID=1071718 RepID=UPI001EFFCE68|nr:B12-binding domain-containing protein [Bacillus mesophilum]